MISEKEAGEINGVYYDEDDKTMKCSNCGCISFRFVGHIDASDYYVNVFKCEKCGSEVSVTVKRLEPWV